MNEGCPFYDMHQRTQAESVKIRDNAIYSDGRGNLIMVREVHTDEMPVFFEQQGEFLEERGRKV